MHLGLLCCFVLVAAERGVAVAKTEPSTARVAELPPGWSAGQSWRVEYLVTVPSTAMRRSAKPPPPRRTVWDYEVIDAGTDRLAVVRVRNEDGSRVYELTFTPGNLGLVSAFRLEGSEREEVDELTPSEPYFGWTQSHPIIFDWPAFAAAPADMNLEFETPGEIRVRQEARRTAEGKLEIVLIHEDGPETTRSRQLWATGFPWWQMASVETEYKDGGATEVVVSISGRLLE